MKKLLQSTLGTLMITAAFSGARLEAREIAPAPAAEKAPREGTPRVTVEDTAGQPATTCVPPAQLQCVSGFTTPPFVRCFCGPI